MNLFNLDNGWGWSSLSEPLPYVPRPKKKESWQYGLSFIFHLCPVSNPSIEHSGFLKEHVNDHQLEKLPVREEKDLAS